MSDRTIFTEDEWHVVTEAPLLISMALALVGPHGPISMIKESTASAKAIALPPDHGAANALIAEIAQEAKSKEARHDAKHHKATTLPATIDLLFEDIAKADTALEKLPADEAAGVKAWYIDIAQKIAEASKGVDTDEQAVVDRLQKLFA
jgi:hypothetical protein